MQFDDKGIFLYLLTFSNVLLTYNSYYVQFIHVKYTTQDAPLLISLPMSSPGQQHTFRACEPFFFIMKLFYSSDNF